MEPFYFLALQWYLRSNLMLLYCNHELPPAVFLVTSDFAMQCGLGLFFSARFGLSSTKGRELSMCR